MTEKIEAGDLVEITAKFLNFSRPTMPYVFAPKGTKGIVKKIEDGEERVTLEILDIDFPKEYKDNQCTASLFLVKKVASPHE